MPSAPDSWSRRSFLRSAALAGLSGTSLLSSSAVTQPALARVQRPDLSIPEVKTGHPRLHFDADGLIQLRKRAESSHERYAELLYEWTDEHLDWGPTTDLPNSEINEVMLEESAAFLTNVALAYLLSGRERYLDRVRTWTFQLLEAPSEPTHEYALGTYAAGLARVYDWLYDEWSERERSRLREHIALMVRHLYEGSYLDSDGTLWWAEAHLHHDLWIPVGGFGEAGLALVGEVDEAEQWVRRAREEFDVALSWLGEDGAWHEGAADWTYAMAPLLWFFGAWKTATGEELHKEYAWIKNSARYRLYHRLPDNTYVYLNDSFRSGRYNTSGSASCHLLRRLASLFEDGHVQWLADRDEEYDLYGGPQGVYQAPYGGSSYRAERTLYPYPPSQCVAWNVLWYDPAVAPQPPAGLSNTQHFHNMDVAILRSGWDEDSAVASLSCGPLGGHQCAERIRAGERRRSTNFTHAHADYNSLTLFANGQYFIVPPGYARRSSRFQNTVAVNGGNLLPDPALRVHLEKVTEGEGYSCAVGEAGPSFPGHLHVERFRRYFMMLDGVAVVFDDLRLHPQRYRGMRVWSDFEWTLHSDPRVHDLSTRGSTAIWQSRETDAAPLMLRVLEPDGFAWNQHTLRSQGDVPMLEALQLVRPEWNAPQFPVLAVLNWTGTPVVAEQIEEKNWIGVTWPDSPSRLAVGFGLQPMDGETDQQVGGNLDRRIVMVGEDKQGNLVHWEVDGR